MRPNGPLETKRSHGARDEAKRGLGGPNEPMKVWMRLLRPNETMEAGMRPLRPNWRPNEAMEARMRPLRPNEALKA